MVSPQRWPERNGGIRRLKLDRFPFIIRYRTTGDTVQFLSILHGSRHPNTGSDRA